MGPTWVLSAPDGPHVSPMNLAIRVYMLTEIYHGAGFRYIDTVYHIDIVYGHSAVYLYVSNFCHECAEPEFG